MFMLCAPAPRALDRIAARAHEQNDAADGRESDENRNPCTLYHDEIDMRSRSPLSFALSLSLSLPTADSAG